MHLVLVWWWGPAGAEAHFHVGFVDLLSPAELNGTFSGPCDTTEVERIQNVVNQYVTNTFGQVLYVHGTPDPMDVLLAASGFSP